MKIRRIFFSILIFSLFSILWAQDFPELQPELPPVPRKRIQSTERFEDRRFILIGVRTSKIIDDFLVIDFKFNKPVNPQSIGPDCILVDGIPFHMESLQFSKNGNSFRIAIKNPPENFNILIQNVKSTNSEILPPLLFEKAEAESVFNFRRREWQKYL